MTDRVSLRPLTPEDALRGLMGVETVADHVLIPVRRSLFDQFAQRHGEKTEARLERWFDDIGYYLEPAAEAALERLAERDGYSPITTLERLIYAAENAVEIGLKVRSYGSVEEQE